MIEIGDIVAFKNHGTNDLSGYLVRDILEDNQVLIELVSGNHLKLQMIAKDRELEVLF